MKAARNLCGLCFWSLLLKNQIIAGVVVGLILLTVSRTFKAAQEQPAQPAGYWV